MKEIFAVEINDNATNKRTHIKREEKLKERGVREALAEIKEN
jgi:hypothetical protein